MQHTYKILSSQILSLWKIVVFLDVLDVITKTKEQHDFLYDTYLNINK